MKKSEIIAILLLVFFVGLALTYLHERELDEVRDRLVNCQMEFSAHEKWQNDLRRFLREGQGATLNYQERVGQAEEKIELIRTDGTVVSFDFR